MRICSAAFLLLSVAASALLGLGGCDACGNSEVISQVKAQGGAWRAVVFTRSCGATTGVGTHVSVVPASGALGNGAGNTFIADADHGKAPTGPKGEVALQVVWAAADHLVIQHPADARVFVAQRKVGAVRVDYEAVKSTFAPLTGRHDQPADY